MSNLLVKAFLGFAFLMLVLALALFIPAGSLSYWQAWVYLADWAICVILMTLYLIKNDRELLAGRVKVGVAAETQKSQKIIQSLASLFFMGVFIVPGLDYRFGWSNISPVLCLIADLFVALGFFIIFLTFRENSFSRATIEVSAGQKVITSGPYRFVRHPMYAGAVVLFLASPIALGSWVAEICTLGLILALAVRLLDEEKFLQKDLTGYTEYCQTVRYHLIPYAW
jgi:protein-S-isoprenylcysteine O-methyltransferase Ste14